MKTVITLFVAAIVSSTSVYANVCGPTGEKSTAAAEAGSSSSTQSGDNKDLRSDSQTES